MKQGQSGHQKLESRKPLALRGSAIEGGGGLAGAQGVDT